MEQLLLNCLTDYKAFALLISMAVSIMVAILGVVPSFFITGANLVFFGFWLGTGVSFLGEAIGAVVAFLLYRKGLRKVSVKPLQKYPSLKKVMELEGRDAFYFIFSLRLLPFVPSGLVTLAGAVGKVSVWTFAVSSSLGKIPALVLEAWSVYQVTQFTRVGKAILVAFAIYLFYVVWRRLRKTK